MRHRLPSGPVPPRRRAAVLCDEVRVRGEGMSELRYPNESKAYRDAREALLKEEKGLIDKAKAVAAKRRELPDGGQLKEDYVFQWANDSKVGQRANFSELFGGKKLLLLYLFMFGPNWGQACPSFTCRVDRSTRA